MSATGTSSAVRMAVDLADSPILARVIRRQPLPPDVLILIKIAAGCPDTLQWAARATGREQEFLGRAAALFLQNVVLSSEADAYRVLGLTGGASEAQLREHLRWLMKWLHPDRTKNDWDSVFARRVLDAWQELKSPDRRARYDRHPASGRDHPVLRKRRLRQRNSGAIPLIAVDAEVPAGLIAFRRLWFVKVPAIVVAACVTLLLIAVLRSSEPTAADGVTVGTSAATTDSR